MVLGRRPARPCSWWSRERVSQSCEWRRRADNSNALPDLRNALATESRRRKIEIFRVIVFVRLWEGKVLDGVHCESSAE